MRLRSGLGSYSGTEGRRAADVELGIRNSNFFFEAAPPDSLAGYHLTRTASFAGRNIFHTQLSSRPRKPSGPFPFKGASRRAACREKHLFFEVRTIIGLPPGSGAIADVSGLPTSSIACATDEQPTHR